MVSNEVFANQAKPISNIHPTSEGGGTDTGNPLMIIDQFMPEFDAVERHEIAIDAAPDRVLSDLWEFDFGSISLVRFLLGLRGLPAFLFKPQTRHLARQPMTLDALKTFGFVELVRDQGREVVFGVTGRFWHPVNNIEPTTSTDYRAPVPPGLARAIWNFSVSPTDAGTILATETRIHCGDRASRRKFLAYWCLVRPFSGLVRILMLRSVRRSCES